MAVREHEKLPWMEPLALAHYYRSAPVMTLFYSGRKEARTGRYSYLALGAREVKTGTRFDELPETGAGDLPEWFGYLGYGMREDCEAYARVTPSPVTLPDFRMVAPETLFIFDHVTCSIMRVGKPIALPCPLAVPPVPAPPASPVLNSNFSDAEYRHAIRLTLEQIAAGAFYQANLTRKFFGHLPADYDAWDLFLRLTHLSPAPYSAFLRYHDEVIISSSPEGFMRVEEHGAVTARPIKGSAARSDDPAEDARHRQTLSESTKERAENLMIVDLIRHDLARIALPGSVRVTELTALYSYATIHHLVSTITAKAHPQLRVAEVLRAAFPPGSMTGAPKIAAVGWCDKIEQMERGVYSGAIGWLGANGTCDFSVVIRTLVMKGTLLEFQVGGGIVADSTPEGELRETEAKARAIRLALGLHG
jgi:anthranilate/para-aminobenzoate synthase component I